MISTSCSKLIFLKRYWLIMNDSSKRKFKFSIFLKDSNLFDRYFQRSSFFQILKFTFIFARISKDRLICHLKIEFLKHMKRIRSIVCFSFMFAIYLNRQMKKIVEFVFESNFMTSMIFNRVDFWNSNSRYDFSFFVRERVFS